MFKKVWYVLFVLIFLIGCTPKAVTQTPTVAHEGLSPVPPAETLSPVELRDPQILQDKQVDLISYQEIDDRMLRLVIRERDSERLVAVTITKFIYLPVTVVNGITSVDHSITAMTYYNGDFFTLNPKFQDTFPPNSAGTVYVEVGDGFSMLAVTGSFIPTETDLYIQGLVDDYQKNRARKAEMIGARALSNNALIYPDNPTSELHFYSLLEDSQREWDFFIPGYQCWVITRSYKAWGTDWDQYAALRQMCGMKDDMLSPYGWSDPYRGLSIDDTGNGNKALGDFNRYYSYASGMLPSVFNLALAQGEICPGGQVGLPGGMTGTAYESPGWVDIEGGFAFEYGIDFVVSFGEQHFFIPYGGYFVVTDAAHTPDEYALFTTCTER